MFHTSLILFSSQLSNLILVCLTTSMYFDGIENDDSVMIRCMWRDAETIKKNPRHTPETSPCAHGVAISIRIVRESALFLHRVTHYALQRVNPSPRPKSRVLFPRRSSRLSGSARFGSVRDVRMLAVVGTICARTYACFLHFFESNFFGLESLRINFGSDVALDVVPVRDGATVGRKIRPFSHNDDRGSSNWQQPAFVLHNPCLA